MKLFPIYVLFPFIFVKVFVYMFNLTEGIWRYEVLASTQKTNQNMELFFNVYYHISFSGSFGYIIFGVLLAFVSF